MFGRADSLLILSPTATKTSELMVQQVFEETDILIKPQNLTLLTEAIDRGYHITYYICKDWSGTPTNKEPDRCSELVWHSIDNLPDDTIPVIKTILTTHDPA